MRNQQRTYAGCPVLTSAEQIAPYLEGGAVPGNVEYLEVPPGKVIRRRGFWLKPGHRMHHTAMLFLVSTDAYAMNVDDLSELRDQIYCYRSQAANTVYLGRVENVAESRLFTPLLDGLHEPFDIDAAELVYVGRVISAI
ncbi:hypothetical protein KUC52_29200 [Pseudomonas aeruginosa]|uniref:hypothetical protein n=1 Tax=Pseudomonas aeruginosa TaxID=287 RepID=UPI0021E18651|nr:hypothetical protein [Pseudomonas aeruginosa]MCV0332918.1 hypothetical protein [Pseudomonas aeruginosa]